MYQEKRQRQMGRRYERMPYTQFVLETVTEENHDKHKRG
jgi:hypothetical protein